MQHRILHRQFLNGTANPYLDGFYKGEVVEIMPKNLLEGFGKFIANFWMPWRGKVFYSHKKRGENILSYSIEPFIRMGYFNGRMGKYEYGGFKAFPFTTSVEKGLSDPIKVLRLNYDLPSNPPFVRQITDELVSIGKNEYLGKAHIKETNRFRTVAYFRLSK